MFSKSCEYGLKAIIYIATQSLENNRVKIGDVAQMTGTPEAFTAKILGTLVKHDILESRKGPYGGFEMEESRMKEIMISQIVTAIDGDSIYKGCALGLDVCSTTDPCPMHDSFISIRRQLKTMLETTSIYELAQKLKTGNTTLLR